MKISTQRGEKERKNTTKKKSYYWKLQILIEYLKDSSL